MFSAPGAPDLLEKFASEGAVGLFWLDVNDATHLLDPNRIRMSHIPNGNPQITAALDAWLDRLVKARTPTVKLLTTGGDEVLVVVSPFEVVGIVGALIEASQLPGKTGEHGETVIAPLTVGCGGIAAPKGAGGQWLLDALSEGTRRAKRLGKTARPIRSVICFSRDGSSWDDYVLEPPGDLQDGEAEVGSS